MTETAGIRVKRENEKMAEEINGRFTTFPGVCRKKYGHGRDKACLLFTSDAADEPSSVVLGGSRIFHKHNHTRYIVSIRDVTNNRRHIVMRS